MSMSRTKLSKVLCRCVVPICCAIVVLFTIFGLGGRVRLWATDRHHRYDTNTRDTAQVGISSRGVREFRGPRKLVKSIFKLAKRSNAPSRHYTGNPTRDDRNERQHSKDHKYLWAWHYSEQLSGCTASLLMLASLAKYGGRSIVAPFVRNSRMLGVPLRPGSYSAHPAIPLDRYYNVSALNLSLIDHGYGAIKTLQEATTECASSLDVLVYFLFPISASLSVASKWYKITPDIYKSITAKALKQGGWAECDFLTRHLTDMRSVNFTVKRVMCVYADTVGDGAAWEDSIFRGAKCVGVMKWPGLTKSRVRLPLHPGISTPLHPSDLQQNQHLLDIAEQFVRAHMKSPFIGVHVRTEWSIIRRGLNGTIECLRQLTELVRDERGTINSPHIFLASDFAELASGTLTKKLKQNQISKLRDQLHGMFNTIKVFDPKAVGLVDSGEVAIVEMHIVSAGRSLFTLGGGRFQDWIIRMFLTRNDNDETQLHRVCWPS